MAKKKNQAARYASPTAASRVTVKGSERAGKAKGDYSARRAQNKGVKDGTVRVGKGGKSYNVYDAKSATWKRGKVAAASKATKPKSGPPNQARKAVANKAEGKKQRMGYNYTSAYGKPTNPYSNRGASMRPVPAGQPKAIRPSGGPTRFARLTKKK